MAYFHAPAEIWYYTNPPASTGITETYITKYFSYELNSHSVTVLFESPSNIFSEEIISFGYKFVEWNTKKDGSGITYLPGDTSTGEISFIPVYAIWEALPIEYITNDVELKSIADAIRGKSGTSGSLEFPDGFVSAIENIEKADWETIAAPIRVQKHIHSSVEINSQEAFTRAVNLFDLQNEYIYKSSIYSNIVFFSSSVINSYATAAATRKFIPIPSNWCSEASYISVNYPTGLNYCSWGAVNGNFEIQGYKTNMTSKSSKYTVSGNTYVYYPAKKYFSDPYSWNNGVYFDRDMDNNIWVSGSTFASADVAKCGCWFSFPINDITFDSIVSTVGASAFTSTTVKHASGSRVTSLYANAFSWCGSLQTVSFPYCTHISMSAFYSCNSLISADFPSCNHIGMYAFAFCGNLSSISFPRCGSINANAFYNCVNLLSADFPFCTDISQYAFQDCHKLLSVSFPECVHISEFAFFRCSSLTTVEFPKCSLIRGSAFLSCINLSEAVFQTCTQINSYAFSSCTRLISLRLTGSSVVTLSNSNAFSSTPIAGYTVDTDGALGSIYVPSSLLTNYQTADNWSFFSDRFVGI